MRVGFALEYSLGHVTHAENLKRALLRHDGRRSIAPTYVDLPFLKTPVGRWANLPGVRSNWSVRASLGAYLGLRHRVAAKQLDALMFHTQVTSLFSAGLMRRVPSVISLDATPLQIDSLGAHYGHQPGGARAESLKRQWNMRAFEAAQALITWSEWAKASLVADYGVPAQKVTVIPPGVNTELWGAAADAARATSERTSECVHLLFVGGDFARKGGDDLLEAWRRLPESVRKRARLHIVTRATPEQLRLYHEDFIEGIEFHRGLEPNSGALLRLYAQADGFVFPTRADCLPLAALEAMAAGLPVITTAVGALPEAVRDGETGLIVPVSDAAPLADAMQRMIGDSDLRRRLSGAAREAARRRYDAATNAQRLLEVIQGVGTGTRAGAVRREAASPVWSAAEGIAARP